LTTNDLRSSVTTETKEQQLTYTVWPDCVDGSRVGFAVYTTGKHLYPRPPNSSPATSEVVWAFLTNTTLALQP
jgi:hypothetical protein